MQDCDRLNLMSESIWSLDSSPLRGLDELLSYGSVKNMQIYRRNLLGTVFEALQEDFPVLANYMGNDNFMFFTRQAILDLNIHSPDIFIFCKEFPDYLETKTDIHQDPLIAPLAKLDRLYHYRSQSAISVPKGLFKCWSQLLLEGQGQDNEIGFDQDEVVEVVEIDGDLALRVRSNNHDHH